MTASTGCCVHRAGAHRAGPRARTLPAAAHRLRRAGDRACYGLYRFAVPVLVEVAVLATPPVVPQLMSRSLLASLDGTVFERPA